MALYKNVASQKIAVYAYDTAADGPKTGDAANITAQISIDGGTTAATNDTNPTELDATDAPGIYLFDMTQAETNGDLIIISPVSATADIQLEPVIIYTLPGANTGVHSDLRYIDGLATSGNNATLNLKQLNIVNSAGTALVAQSTGSNGAGIAATGHGTGSGIGATGGGTDGAGLLVTGGATNGAGLRAVGTGTGGGINATSVSGSAILGTAGSGNTHGMSLTGSGSGHGLKAVGGSTGDGLNVTGGSFSGNGLSAIATGSGVDLNATTTDSLEVNSTKISGNSTAADRAEQVFLSLVVGAAQTGTLSTTQMSTNLTEATNDHYNGRLLTWVTGVLTGQQTDITDYDGTSKVLTFTATTEAPGDGDAFVIT